jgi:Rrf2 family protein
MFSMVAHIWGIQFSADARPDNWPFALLTRKGKYGLKAMIHLAGLEPGEVAQIAGIAEANGIPKKFLDQILSELRKAGFVHSKKGKAGGYALAKPAHSISAGQIIRVLDGPLAPIQCSSVTAYRRCDDCSDEERCAVRHIMVEARNALSAVLDTRSLAEMRLVAEQH